MAYGAKTYTLREESTESGKRYFISFKDGQGEHHELEVSEQLFIEFRQMERRNRNLQQWNQRHREFNEVWDETLYRRALRVPKSLDERMIEKERNELFYKAVARLPEIQRRRFLLYYEYDFNPKEVLIPRSLLRNKLMTNEVSLGLIPRSLLRGVSFFTKSQGWSIAPLPLSRSPFQLQGKRSRQK